jgi:hypothetical protein
MQEMPQPPPSCLMPHGLHKPHPHPHPPNPQL